MARSGGAQSAGVRSKPRARGRKTRTGRSRGTRGNVRGRVLGAAAARAESSEDGISRPLDFQPRYSPKPTANWAGILSYLIFLLLFLSVTVLRRNSDVYYFSEMVKRVVMTDHFLAIGADTDYFEWLSLHFFPGLTGISYMAAPDSNFKLVGAPRIRQVRAAPCEADLNLDSDGDGWADAAAKDDDASVDTYHPRKIVPACWQNDEETGSTESFGGQDGSLFTYQDATEIAELPWYNSEGGVWLPGGGFVVPVDMLKRLMVGATGRPEEAATVEVPVTEFYGFSYTGYNVSELQNNGWWNARTTAIFHDFTIAASNGMYCHCRLVVTVGINHGLIHPSVEMHMMWLESFPETNVLLDIVFFLYVIVLTVGEGLELYEVYKSPNQLIKEFNTEKRYQLYQRFQQYAAFYGIAKYDPHVYMKKLMRRLHVTYQDDPPEGSIAPTPRHIEHMNKIGLAMVKVHEDWKGMVDVGTRKADFKLSAVDEEGRTIVDEIGQRQAALATLSLFDQIQELHGDLLNLKALEKFDGSNLGLYSPQQFYVRFPIALRLFFSNPWNFMDALNYLLFMWALWVRVQSLQLVPYIVNDIQDLNADTIHMAYINFSELAEMDRRQYNINAFNAILTWIKIFKYLDFYPPMLTLINTLSRAATMLGSLVITIGIVLLGSGQGFFMAFGLEVYMYRDFGSSVMGLLRMAVGDFDYTELAQSNRTLGPLMFWLYIILVFFVVMSMFIALVSEAFEEAKEAQQNRGHKVGGYIYRMLPTPQLLKEAGHRFRFSSPKNTGLMSSAMARELAEFDDTSQHMTALSLFLAHQKDVEKRRHGGDDKQHDERGQPRSYCCSARQMRAGWEHTFCGKKWIARRYWETGQAVISTTGEPRAVPGWFKRVEAKRNGILYIAAMDFRARDRRELSFSEGDYVVVTEQPPGGLKHPATGKRKEGVWKGYLKNRGPAEVRIVYGFDKQDDEGRYTLGGWLKEVERTGDKLASAVDLSDGEEDELLVDELQSATAVSDDHAEAVDGETSEEDTTDDEVEHTEVTCSDHGSGIAEQSELVMGTVQSSPAKKLARDMYHPLSLAQTDSAYSATDNSHGTSFGETRQHRQSRKEQEMEKRLVDQEQELRKLRKENEALKVESLNRRESQMSHSRGTGSAGLEVRVDAITEAIHGTIPAAIAASNEALKSELDEIKVLLRDGGNSKQLQLLDGGQENSAHGTRGGALSSDRALANRGDGKWVKMANIEGGTLYGDAEEYWHHTGTNAIRKSPPSGVQVYSDTGEPVEIDGAAMRWDDESNDSITNPWHPPGQVVDPIVQSRLREKQRKRAQNMENARKAGEPGYAYGMRTTPASMALESNGLSRPSKLHLTASKVAGGTMR